MVKQCDATGLNSKDAELKFIRCGSYLTGLAEGLSIGSDAAQDGHPFCIPSMRGGDLIASVLADIKKHPELLSQPAAKASATALARNFPCSNSN
jgi:hypothetical protein